MMFLCIGDNPRPNGHALPALEPPTYPLTCCHSVMTEQAPMEFHLHVSPDVKTKLEAISTENARVVSSLTGKVSSFATKGDLMKRVAKLEKVGTFAPAWRVVDAATLVARLPSPAVSTPAALRSARYAHQDKHELQARVEELEAEVAKLKVCGIVVLVADVCWQSCAHTCISADVPTDRCVICMARLSDARWPLGDGHRDNDGGVSLCVAACSSPRRHGEVQGGGEAIRQGRRRAQAPRVPGWGLSVSSRILQYKWNPPAAPSPAKPC